MHSERPIVVSTDNRRKVLPTDFRDSAVATMSKPQNLLDGDQLFFCRAHAN